MMMTIMTMNRILVERSREIDSNKHWWALMIEMMMMMTMVMMMTSMTVTNLQMRFRSE